MTEAGSQPEQFRVQLPYSDSLAQQLGLTLKVHRLRRALLSSMAGVTHTRS